jgi:hypothetical protein
LRHSIVDLFTLQTEAVPLKKYAGDSDRLFTAYDTNTSKCGSCCSNVFEPCLNGFADPYSEVLTWSCASSRILYVTVRAYHVQHAALLLLYLAAARHERQLLPLNELCYNPTSFLQHHTIYNQRAAVANSLDNCWIIGAAAAFNQTDSSGLS